MVVGVSTAVNALAWGVRSTFALFYVAMLEEFAWGRGPTALGYSLSWLGFVVFAPVAGWLSDRYDSRILLMTYYGLRGLALLYLPYGFVSESHGLSLFAVFYGLDWIATVPPTVALTRQAFGAEKAGLVFGWIMAAHQVGAAMAASFAGFIRTNEGNYDHAFIFAGFLCMISAVGVLFAGKRPAAPALSPQPG